MNLVLVLGFASALFLDLSADPSIGKSDLEGQIVLGADARLDGEPPPLGDWAPDLVSPTQIVLTAAAFRSVGADVTVARGVTAAVAVLSLLLFLWLIAEARGPGIALLAGCLLVSNSVFFGVSRTAVPAAYSLFWMLAAIRLWTWSARLRFLALPAGFVIIWAALFENGPTNAFFLPVGAAVAVIVRLHAWKMPWLPLARRRLGLFWFAFVLGLLAFAATLLARGREFDATWGHLSLGGWSQLATNLLLSPIYFGRLVEIMPLTVLLVAGYFLFHARDLIRPVARHRRVDETGLAFLFWLLGGTSYFILMAAQPLDALALLLPPAALVAAEGLRGLYSLRSIARPRIDVMIVMTLIAGCVWFLVALLVHRFYAHIPLPDAFREHQIRGSFFLIATGWVIFTALLGWLYLQWKRFEVRLPPALVVAATVLLAVGIPLHGTYRILAWWEGRTHEVRTAAASLAGTVPPGALVVGSWAPVLTLGSEARGAVVLHGVNEEPAPWNDHISHVLLDVQSERRSDAPAVALLERLGRGWEPEPVAAFQIAGGRLTLHRVAPPPVVP